MYETVRKQNKLNERAEKPIQSEKRLAQSLKHQISDQ